MDYREFERTPLDLPADGLTYTLPQGGSAGSLASDLVAAGYLPARWEPYLRWLAWSSGRAAQLKAGEYRLAPGLTASGLLDLLVSGKVVQYPLTIIEGWTFRQLRAAVREHRLAPDPGGWTTPPSWRRWAGRASTPRAASFRTPISSRAAPRTSSFSDAPTSAWAPCWTRPGASASRAAVEGPYQVLVLASIVERNPGWPPSARRSPACSSGVCRRGNEAAGRSDRDLRTRKRLRRQPAAQRPRDRHAYNSYTRTGLPPTPICLPGRAAIHAVVSPGGGGELYFVAKGDGSHYFSASLDEHQRAVNQYQRKRPGTP